MTYLAVALGALIVGVNVGAVIMWKGAGSKMELDDNFSCAGCMYAMNEFDFDEPCVRCRRTYDDQWNERGSNCEEAV